MVFPVKKRSTFEISKKKANQANQENERHPRFGTIPDSFPLPWSTARPEVVELVAQAA